MRWRIAPVGLVVALALLLGTLVACKPKSASNTDPGSEPASDFAELVRLAIWPDEETRWQVCEAIWEEFSRGGYLQEDIYAAASRYVVPIPVEGVRGKFRLVLPLAGVVLDCGKLALEGTRPYRPSNRPPLMLHQPFLDYQGPEKPPANWEAWLLLQDEQKMPAGTVSSTRLEEPYCVVDQCLGQLVFIMAYPSRDYAQVEFSALGYFFLKSLSEPEWVRDLVLEVKWGQISTEVVLDFGGLRGAP
ncbi:hypothetical protein ACKLNZ_08405 [Thermus scotoductus]